MERLLKRGELVAEQELLRLPQHKVTLAADQAKLEEKLRTLYAEAGLTPPNLKDVLEDLSLEAKELMPVMRLLCERNILVKVKGGHVFLNARTGGAGAAAGRIFRGP